MGGVRRSFMKHLRGGGAGWAPAPPWGSVQAELLGGGVVAVVDLQQVAGGLGVAGVVQAPPGVRVEERAVGPAGPGLRGGAVAVEQLDRGVVGRRPVDDVEALAEDADAAVTGRRPALR